MTAPATRRSAKLLATTALVPALFVIAAPALAQDSGGNGGGGGGAGGASANLRFNGRAADGGSVVTPGATGGGGGGGSGTSPGRGGQGAGGTPGGVNGANGQNGDGVTFIGGGGGSGGFSGFVFREFGTVEFFLSRSSLPGGNGGAGGGLVGAGGGGGAGATLIIAGSANMGVSAGTVLTGGAGGLGGAGTLFGGGGDGGDGGAAMTSFIAGDLTIRGELVGGGGGAGGPAVTIAGRGGDGGAGLFIEGGRLFNEGLIRGGFGGVGSVAGAGGIGLIGDNAIISNTGTIAGGLSGDGVTRSFAMRLSGTSTITNIGTLTGGVEIASGTTVFDIATDQTLANVISGGGAIAKRGTGTLTLTADNLYTGTTTIEAGVLRIGNGGTTGFLGTGDVINNASLVFERSDFVVVQNSISGSGSLTKRGAGALVLTAGNNFSGGLSVEGGAIGFTSTSLGRGTISLADGTRMFNIALNPETLANNISIASGGTATLENGTGTPVRLAGVIAGGTLLKAGQSQVNFQNDANSFNGLDVQQGAVGISANRGFGTGKVTFRDGTSLVVRAADLNIANDIDLSGAVTIASGSETLTLSGRIAGDRLIKVDSGTLILTGTNTYADTTIVQGGTLIARNAGALGSSFAGTAGTESVLIADFDGEFANAYFTSGGTLAAGDGRTVTLTGSLALGLGGGGKFGLAGGTGILVLDHSSFSIPTSFRAANSIEGGTVRIGSAFAEWFPILTRETASTAIQAAGTLDINGNTMELFRLTGTGTILNSGAAATLTLIESTFAGTFDSGAGGLTLAGAITGDSGFIKRGSGVLTLASDLDLAGFTGGFTVAQGTLSLQASLASTFGSIRTTGSVIDYADGVTSAAPIIIDSDATRLQVLSGTATQSGVISELGGARGFEKIGAGTLTLAAANTYTGQTTVAGGTLHVTNAAALGSPDGGTRVLDGATLALGNSDGFMIVDEATTIRGNGVTNTGALRGELFGARLTRAVTLAALGSGRLIKDGSTGLWLFDTQAQISELLIKSGEVVFLSDTGTINNTIADTAAVMLEGGALNLSLSETIGSLAGGADARVFTIGPGSTLTVGANNASTEFAGVIRPTPARRGSRPEPSRSARTMRSRVIPS